MQPDPYIADKQQILVASTRIPEQADAAAAAASGGAATSVPLDGDTLQGMAVKWLASAVASVLGSGDDNLGSGSMVIRAEDWMTGNLAPLQTEAPMSYNYSQRRLPGFGVDGAVLRTDWPPDGSGGSVGRRRGIAPERDVIAAIPAARYS